MTHPVLDSGGLHLPDSVLPRQTPDNRPFWEATRAHRLVVPFCAACNKAFYPIGPRCPRCFSDKLSWTEPTDQPKLASWIRYQKPYFDWLKGVVPYVCGLVDVCPGVRMPVLIWPTPAGDPQIGGDVTLGFLDVAKDISLPVFSISATDTSPGKPK